MDSKQIFCMYQFISGINLLMLKFTELRSVRTPSSVPSVDFKCP